MDVKKPFDRFLIPLFIVGIFSLGLSLLSNTPEEQGKLRVSYLSVGQGDSSLIKTPKGKYILVDGGPDKSVLTEMGKLMPPTERSIEAVILSHPHADHVSGLNYVLDRYKVGKVYLTGTSYNSPDYVEFLNKIRDLKIPAEKFYEGRNIYIDEVTLSAFWPKEDITGKIFSNTNDTSIVFNLNYKENNFLFTGDLSKEKQDEIVKDTILKKVDVLKVPHHGSKTGISEALLKMTNPDYAVISVGADNRFGHPSQEALSVLSEKKIFRTDILGTITFISDGNTITY